MEARTFCRGDPNVYGEATLDEFLAEPMVRLVMARDGVDARSIRDLASELRERLRLYQLGARGAIGAVA
jgi:hypothetical protein